jgi:hypothetical protein
VLRWREIVDPHIEIDAVEILQRVGEKRQTGGENEQDGQPKQKAFASPRDREGSHGEKGEYTNDGGAFRIFQARYQDFPGAWP